MIIIANKFAGRSSHQFKVIRIVSTLIGTWEDMVQTRHSRIYLHVCTCIFIVLASPTDPAEVETNDFTVQTSLKLDLPLHLIIPSANIKLNETIGQGNPGPLMGSIHICSIYLVLQGSMA